ncbi:hypothetical protein CLV42_11769 [Chitinophaga ginsengisoli]|uniref:GcrA cell cycle regulator n=1 Tax=Chitinophaga ginsengisoli TaxID=363837 RepID=A0A2P8FPU4_9BACT|nr:hypothetical protein CLV42_11769 [Chitinophaga ginsengisoli]
MSKTPKNSGKSWTNNDLDRLNTLAAGNTPTRLIAWKMGRSEDSIRSKASDEGISLKPTNQSPYNRR